MAAGPDVSIVTAMRCGAVPHLGEAWASIRDGAAAAGLEVEWIVQEDGTEPCCGAAVAEATSGDARVRYDVTGRAQSAATARNLALHRASGPIVVALDADDRLAPSGLSALVAPLLVGGSTVWVAGRAVDLYPDGSLVEFDGELLAPGLTAPGAVVEAARRLGHFPFHGACGAVRTTHLRAVGGWPALPRAEDAAMWAAVSTRWPGYMVDAVVHHYRRWPGQQVAGPGFADLARWVPAMFSQADAEQSLGAGDEDR